MTDRERDQNGAPLRRDQDEIDRWIGLELDGRLGEPERRELDLLLKQSGEARRTLASYSTTRDTIRTLKVPVPSHELLAKTLQRVEAARGLKHREGVVLPWIRGIAIAAALLLAANTAMFKTIHGDDQKDKLITVEDEIRAAGGKAQQPDSLVDYLAWYFLRRGR